MNRKGKIVLLAVVLLFLFSVGLWQLNAVKRIILPLRIADITFFNIPENRLRFKVVVSTNRSSKAYIKYWADRSRDTLYTALSPNDKLKTVFITNTIAQTDYHFMVVGIVGTEEVESKVYSFSTKPIYQAMPYFDLAYSSPKFEKNLKDRFFLTQILTEPGSMVIIDHKGNIVWYQPFKKATKVTHWTAEHTVMAILGAENIPSSGGDEIIEVDLNGKTLFHVKVGKGQMDKMVHHEVRKDEKNNVYAITFDKKIFDLSSVGGSKRDTVHGDGIVLFNPQGKKIWEWSMLDHLNPLKDSLILQRKKDWVHANSVFKDKDGNFLISYRDLNQVWKVQYPSGNVLWKFGEGGDFSLTKEELFAGQHAVHTMPNGLFLMLDNGLKRKISRGMAFMLDEKNKKAVSKFIVPLPKDYFSPAKGNVSFLDNQHLLFCLTEPRTFFITDMKGKIVWDLKVGGDPYRLEEIKGFKMAKPLWHD